ncbi:MAG: phosphodiester glycosidase family protein [Armatimonadota bacterium]|nr:phosphodiester glycosidase family protein [Armatimonadota bacterium]MDR7436161.1 phosphodiester glycosidase family protein [Armatimonadota bacterium]MDR7472040.1 phosphodiester glycosidase family protein [Armatimonadota bacterium]MDR7507135.1 phosphodiester glycosidase family protein [Armatimonadota bacterium]MDR7517061.1 phosphodiester glycosidase family protein [Armatimonadota bacterium]
MRVLACALVSILLLPLAVQAQPPATDAAGHWAEDRIRLLVRRGIVDVTGGLFSPDLAVTRAEFIAWLVRALGLPLRPSSSAVTDVPASHPLAPYVEAAVVFGLVPRGQTFAPDAPVTRADAVAQVVSALGYAFEAVALADEPPLYDDVAELPPALRGAIAVAARTDPPLWQEPPAAQFRPSAALTRAEAAGLVGGALLASEQGLRLRYALGAEGLDLLVERRGVLRIPPLWRVQVGAFTSEDNARRLAAAVEARGLPVVVEFVDGLYKVRVGAFATPAEAALARDELASEGYPTWVVQTVANPDILPGPFRVAAVVVDTRRGLQIRPAVGDGQRMRRVRTTDVARRLRALAAVNANFFSPSGDPLGCLMVDGALLSEPDPQRSCAGLTDDGGVVIDRVGWDAAVVTPDARATLDGVNRERGPHELILYRPPFDTSTRTNPYGAEAVVRGGVVVAVTDGRGNTAIPPDGVVISGHGRARQWILQHLAAGTPVDVQVRLVPASGDPRWERVRHAVGGGPRLLAGGQLVSDEGFPATLVSLRHPRTALGILADGRIALVVVDGRQPTHSLGMTLVELALELYRLGAVDGINLDGGGSSTLVAGGRLMNRPADETGERMVPAALVVLPAGP